MKVGDLVERYGYLAIIVDLAPSTVVPEAYSLKLKFLTEASINSNVFNSLFVTNLGECPSLLKELCETH
jgi:hypothetical protein